MCFDDPIYLDWSSFEELLVDTDQRRICWMYHDVLSHPRVAWMLDKYAGKGAPVRDTWTTMAWVAAGCQEDSFYLLFKWYENFYAPPERSDLYFIEREQGPDGELRIRWLSQDFQNKLDERSRARCESFLSRVSRNASDFFGETEFDSTPAGRAIALLDSSPGRELVNFDRYFGRRSDGEKYLLCATMSAYFRSIEAVREILFSLLDRDGKAPGGGRHMGADELLSILGSLTGQVDERRLSELGAIFQELADSFFTGPTQAPYLGRGAGRLIKNLTESGELHWLRLERQSARPLLRELYCRCDPRRVWDIFHRWRGEVYCAVLTHQLTRNLPRGVYLLSRFEDQTGLDITGLFWLEYVSVGVAHLCQGEFFEELLEQINLQGTPSTLLPAWRPWGEDKIGSLIHQIKETFDQVFRGER